MRILSIGTFKAHNRNNTCSHRSDCLKKHATEKFTEIDSTINYNIWTKIINKLSYYGIKFYLPDNTNINQKIIDEIKKEKYDIVWIDKGNIIYPKTLSMIKEMQPQCIIVHYMIDDFMNPYHASKQIIKDIPLYDYYIVNRKKNIEELKERGCKNPIFTYMSYESKFHFPRTLSKEDRIKLNSDVSFIGTYEKDRAESILYLAKRGVKVRIWGNGWKKFKNKNPNLIIENHGLYNEDFCKAIKCSKINLAFLRKKSRDLHTTRSFEIPACGGFMLAERTEEHQDLYVEDKEAVFFSTNEELFEKCLYYLSHDEERIKITMAGYQRCNNSGHTNQETINAILNKIVLSHKSFQ